LKYGDVVVRKEALRSVPILFPRLIQDRENLDEIPGIAFKRDGEIISSDPRFLTPEELGNVAFPDYDEKTRKGVHIATIETTIGCPHDCPYCGVTDFYGGKYRCKPIDYSIGELQMLYDIHMGHGFFFIDDNFAANPKRTKQFLREMIDRKLNKKFGIAQVTVNASKDDELLDLMYKARIRHICVGFESSNDETLKFLGKPFNSEMNKQAAMIFRKHKLHVHGMFMIGGTDTEESLREELEFAKRYTDSAQFFATSPVPGTRFYKKMQEENKILSDDFSLYDGHYLLLRSENEHMTPYKSQKMIQYANEEYYSLENNINRLKTSPNFKTSLGLLLYTVPPASGVSRVFRSNPMKAHLKFLKSIS